MILTFNPKVLLIGSTLQQAKQIEELIDLYGDEWGPVYQDLINKKRLETTYNKQVCNEVSSNKTISNRSCKCNYDEVKSNNINFISSTK